MLATDPFESTVTNHFENVDATFKEYIQDSEQGMTTMSHNNLILIP